AKIDNQSGDAERTHVDIDQAADGSVTVKTDYGESFWRWFGQQPCNVDYMVRVPRSCWLQVRCVSSNAVVKGLTGQFDMSMVSGDLTLAELTGSLKAHLVSGGLSADQLNGPADIETVSGRVELHACKFESLKVSTVSGRVGAETPLSNGPYRFHSVSGDVRLSVPADARCSIDSNSLTGRLDANLPVTYNQKVGQHWRMEVQGGGPEVRFDSISGTLHVNGAGGAVEKSTSTPQGETAPVVVKGPAPSDSSASEPTSPIVQAAQTRRDILERVSRGELSVNEAIDKLRG
ncbi:MAG TPA: DUF4097 family beta strand repeat-containing protein, partial [Anaerolineae bacterium]